MKIEVVRKIDDNNTIIINELANKDSVIEKVDSVLVVLDELTNRIKKI